MWFDMVQVVAVMWWFPGVWRVLVLVWREMVVEHFCTLRKLPCSRGEGSSGVLVGLQRSDQPEGEVEIG